MNGDAATVTVDVSDLGIDVPPGTPITVTATASGRDGGAQSAVEAAEIKTITIDATGNVLYSDSGTIAVLGVDDLAVIKSGDAVLVVPKSRSQEVRRIVEEIERRRRDDLL